MSVVANFAIFPSDRTGGSSPYVARALKIIREAGLPYDLHAMGTCIEGEWEEVMAVVERCFRDLERDCDRIYLTLACDYRKGPSGRLESKVRSVAEKLEPRA